MSPRKLSHIIAAVTLTTLLALPGTARADSGAGDVSGFWQWLVGLWEEVAGEASNAGPGFDPNGGQSSSQSDAGPGFDPNGG